MRRINFSNLFTMIFFIIVVLIALPVLILVAIYDALKSLIKRWTGKKVDNINDATNMDR